MLVCFESYVAMLLSRTHSIMHTDVFLCMFVSEWITLEYCGKFQSFHNPISKKVSRKIQSFLDLSTHSVKYFKAFALTNNIHGQEAKHLGTDRRRPESSFSNGEGTDWWLDGRPLDSHSHPAGLKLRKHEWNADREGKVWREKLHTSEDCQARPV